MASYDLTLELGEEPAFDHQVAAVVRFGEMRFSEGRTPGEVQLELLNGRFDEQVVHNAVPVLEAIYDQRQTENGFRHWVKTRPLKAERGLDRILGDVIAVLVVLALFTYLIARFSLRPFVLEEPAQAVAFMIAPIVALPLSYLCYRIDRFRCARRVARYRGLLKDAGPPSSPSRDVFSLSV